MTKELQTIINQTNVDFKKLTAYILNSYLNSVSEEDMKVISLLDDHLSVIGTGKQEFYKTLEEFLQSFIIDVKQREKIHFEWKNFFQEERRLDEHHVLVYGKVLILGVFESGSVVVNMDTRFTILYGMVDGIWKVLHIHHSVPDKEQMEDEEFPRTLGNQIEESKSVFKVLSRNFKNVYLVNLKKKKAKILKFETTYVKIPVMNDYQEFPYDDLIVPWVDTLVHPEDREMLKNALSVENLKTQLSEHDEYVGNYRSIANNEVRYFQYNASKIPDSKDTIILGFQNIDAIIEEHKLAEKEEREKEEVHQKQLIAAKESADRANAAKTEFLMRMSHDIRTPINGIMGMLDIEDKYCEDTKKLAECRGKIREASNILLDLINEVLDMSKLESGEIILDSVPFDLLNVSKEVYYAVKKQADDKDVTIVQDQCDVNGIRLIGSAVHLKRVMMNIVGNAVKYNKDHGKIYITCRVVDNDGTTANLQFKCKDTGIGMSQEFLEHVFEPFTQENTSSRTKYTGTGLGMSITKSIVDKMGGTISVQSVKGEGTTFEVMIPFKIDHSTTSILPKEEKEYSIQGMNILLVEDNELNMEIAKFLLEERGANVIEAWNGKEAVDQFLTLDDIDCILMDVMMPVMDGYSATKAIRNTEKSNAKTIPIIAMTANAFAEDKAMAMHAGMNAHISKPLDANKVVETIAHLVTKKPPVGG